MSTSEKKTTLYNRNVSDHSSGHGLVYICITNLFCDVRNEKWTVIMTKSTLSLHNLLKNLDSASLTPLLLSVPRHNTIECGAEMWVRFSVVCLPYNSVCWCRLLIPLSLRLLLNKHIGMSDMYLYIIIHHIPICVL